MIPKNLFNACHQRLFPEGYEPSEMDILCGGQGRQGSRTVNDKTKNLQDWPGNQRYVQILSDHVNRYMKATKRVEKTAVVVSILDVIDATGARFVKLDKKTGRYCELSSDQIYEKTSHSIRSMIKNKSVTASMKTTTTAKRQATSPKHRSKSMTSIQEMKENSSKQVKNKKVTPENRRAYSVSSITFPKITDTAAPIKAEQVSSCTIPSEEEIVPPTMTSTCQSSTSSSNGTDPSTSEMFSPIPLSSVSTDLTKFNADDMAMISNIMDQQYNCDTYNSVDCFENFEDDKLEYNDIASMLEILQTINM